MRLAEQASFSPVIDDDGQVSGIEVLDIRPNSPLAEAGVADGVVCTEVNGVRITGLDTLTPALQAQPGNEICITCTDPSGNPGTFCF